VAEHDPLTESRRFGRYLRRIREERKLSLDSVEEMTLSYPERITKSHLSRIENGQAVPTFPRMFALSQIYGVCLLSWPGSQTTTFCKRFTNAAQQVGTLRPCSCLSSCSRGCLPGKTSQRKTRSRG